MSEPKKPFDPEAYIRGLPATLLGRQPRLDIQSLEAGFARAQEAKEDRLARKIADALRQNGGVEQQSPGNETPSAQAGLPGRNADAAMKCAYATACEYVANGMSKNEAATLSVEHHYPGANDDRKKQLAGTLRDYLKPSKTPKWAK